MGSPEWSYHRNGCRTCARAQDFMVRHKIKLPETVVDARKTRMGESEALKLAASADEIFATKGSKVIHISMKRDKPNSDTLLDLLIGPSGNLRAPSIKAGKTLLVGFDEKTYKRVLF